MPRAIRVQDAGYLHHVVAKGNDNLVLFRDSSDYLFYLSLLEQARKDFPTHIYNYSLTEGSIHLLIEPQQEGCLSKFMEFVSKNYARYFNKKYNRKGHVFSGRFKSFVLQDEKYFFNSSRYIDFCILQEGKKADPRGYRWSAFSVLAHGKEAPLSVDFHDLYIDLGGNDYERQVAYRALVSNFQGEEIDYATRRADIMGDREFKKQVRGK